MTINHDVYQRIIAAASNKSSVTYASLARVAGLDTEMQQDRNTLGEILGAISTYEHENSRPLLTVVVWFTGKSEPSNGFYNLAEKLGLYSKRHDKDSFFISELNKVYEFWGNELNHPKSRAVYLYPDDLPENSNYYEGCKKTVTVNTFERSSKARKECISHFGAICSVCSMDFEKTFGEIGLGFIHVHHKVELSTVKEEYKVNPIEDLIPVCPNCHAMLHQRKPPYTTEELANIISNRKNA